MTTTSKKTGLTKKQFAMAILADAYNFGDQFVTEACEVLGGIFAVESKNRTAELHGLAFASDVDAWRFSALAASGQEIAKEIGRDMSRDEYGAFMNSFMGNV